LSLRVGGSDDQRWLIQEPDVHDDPVVLRSLTAADFGLDEFADAGTVKEVGAGLDGSGEVLVLCGRFEHAVEDGLHHARKATFGFGLDVLQGPAIARRSNRSVSKNGAGNGTPTRKR
jgi:hypothetical protein